MSRKPPRPTHSYLTDTEVRTLDVLVRRRTRIRLDRFRPTSTGYTLITTCRRCGHSESDHGNASGPDRWHCASCGHGDYHPFYPEGEQP